MSRRFYGDTRKDATVQGYPKHLDYAARIDIDERILRIAEAEYERVFGTTDQTIDELRQRGGLTITEVVALLGDVAVRYAPPDALVPKSLTIPAADRGQAGEEQ